MHKTDEIIRAFKLCIKEFDKDNKILERQYYKLVVSLLIREARGEESIGLLKYFEDFLPSTCKDYF